jgi:hypothetical protein
VGTVGPDNPPLLPTALPRFNEVNAISVYGLSKHWLSSFFVNHRAVFVNKGLQGASTTGPDFSNNKFHAGGAQRNLFPLSRLGVDVVSEAPSRAAILDSGANGKWGGKRLSIHSSPPLSRAIVKARQEAVCQFASGAVDVPHGFFACSVKANAWFHLVLLPRNQRGLTVSIVDNSLDFVKHFSRFVLKGLASHVYNSQTKGSDMSPTLTVAFS